MLFTILTVFLFAASCSCKDVIITIENGQVKGQVVELRNKTIDVFKGIRFGKPPIGELRFRRPEKAENWTDIYDATTEKSSCWQYHFDPRTRNLSEDCLFVNVWAPHNSSKPKAVLVWFFGGGLQSGSIFESFYNALPIATLDVVVVTVNYRVGPWGFLFDGSEEAPGNAGLYDQLLALKWVHSNIHAFGGNPKQVTIFGESAGGWSVSYHIISPLSKGLFKNGIMQSGAIFSDSSFVTKNEALNSSKKYTQHFRCNDTTCLKKLDPLVLNNYTSDSGRYLPVVGEAFYPVKSYDAVKSGRFNTDVNIIAGVNADEGSIFVCGWFKGVNSSSRTFKQDTENYLNNQMKSWKHLESENDRKKVIEFYLANETQVDNIKNRTGQVFGDYVLTCPPYYMAKDVMLWSGNSKVYFYKLTYSKGSFSHGQCNEPWVGVGHGDDIEYVFGTPFIQGGYTEQDRQFALLIMNLWTNFAKTGDPMKGHFEGIHLPGINLSKTKWPSLKKISFTEVETKVMDLSPQRFGLTLNEPFKNNCEQLWRPILKI